MELLLRTAGVDAETLRWAISDLDEAAVGMLVSERADMLDLGIEAGRMLETRHPFVMHLPGEGVCRSCNGGGGRHDGAACDGRVDDDAPCPHCQGTGVNDSEPIVLIYRQDEMATSANDVATAA